MPRGGARENSGRKPKWNLGETKAIRVPIAIADTLLDIAKRMDNGENLNHLRLNVLIEDEEGGVSATLLGWPDCQAKGTTRQEALARLRQLVQARLQQAEIVALDLNGEGVN
jgi:hypothetical protein